MQLRPCDIKIIQRASDDLNNFPIPLIGGVAHRVPFCKLDGLLHPLINSDIRRWHSQKFLMGLQTLGSGAIDLFLRPTSGEPLGAPVHLPGARPPKSAVILEGAFARVVATAEPATRTLTLFGEMADGQRTELPPPCDPQYFVQGFTEHIAYGVGATMHILVEQAAKANERLAL